jgi:hypothetical protein
VLSIANTSLQDMLLRNEEVQYVADMPLDNLTVDPNAAVAACSGLSSRLTMPLKHETI